MKSPNEILNEIYNKVDLPYDAVFSTYSESSDKYSFLFKHIDETGEIIYEEDRIVIITDKEGNIIKKTAKWLNKNIQSTLKTTLVSMLSGSNEVKIRQIKKDMYFLYKPGKLKDFYPTIERDNMVYLLDDNGNIIGQMIPPPQDNNSDEEYIGGITWSGAHESMDIWKSYRANAYLYYSKWCTQVYNKGIPEKEELLNEISNPNNIIYYAIAHGGSMGCTITTEGGAVGLYGGDIRDCLESRDKYKFVFLGHCRAMTYTDKGSFAYEFAKGNKSENYAVIGYYKMGSHQDAWRVSKDWQNRLFHYMNEGQKIYDAFQNANLDYPEMEVAIRFEGDQNCTIRSLLNKINVDVTDISFVKSRIYTDEIPVLSVTCSNQSNVPGWFYLNIERENTLISTNLEHFNEGDPSEKEFTYNLEPEVEEGNYRYCSYTS